MVQRKTNTKQNWSDNLVARTKIVLGIASGISILTALGNMTLAFGSEKTEVKLSSTEKNQAVNITDISGHWAEDYIKTSINAGYVDGYQDNTFRPDNEISRAEFTKMIVTAIDENTEIPTSSPWYWSYVLAADKNGFHKNSDYTTGDWNTPMTRQELARIAVRAAGKDEGNTNDRKWMFLATSAGLMQGIDDNETLAPDATTTRAQTIAVIDRVKGIREGKTYPTEKYAISNAEILWHDTNLFTMLPIFNQIPQPNVRGWISPSDQWDKSDRTVERVDDNFKGHLDKLIVVDYNNLNDPNYDLLSDLSGNYVYWNVVNDRGRSGPGYHFDPSVQAFAIVPKWHGESDRNYFNHIDVRINGEFPHSFTNPDGYHDNVELFDQPRYLKYYWRSVPCTPEQKCITTSKVEDPEIILIPKAPMSFVDYTYNSESNTTTTRTSGPFGLELEIKAPAIIGLPTAKEDIFESHFNVTN